MAALGPNLTDMEIASRLVLGEDPDARSLPRADPKVTPLQALEEVILPALQRPPCLVAFSGGRDSSAILAVAVSAARRHGLGLPIPVTSVFPYRETRESEWQEDVVRHLGVSEWHRPKFTDELDLLGPYAQRVLLRHGVIWPPTSHFLIPLLEPATGGTLITGIAGDSLLGGWNWSRAAGVMSGAVMPQPRDVLRVALALAPSRVRRLRLPKRFSLDLVWLLPEARQAVERAFYAQEAAEPLRWKKRIRWLARLRYFSMLGAASHLLADDVGAAIAHPLLDPRFLAALSAVPGRKFHDRTVGMRALFGELLPEPIIARADKAGLDPAFWGPYARDFIERWSGGGVPVDLVDEHTLAAEWRRPEPHAGSDLLLQSAWLAAARGVAGDQCRP